MPGYLIVLLGLLLLCVGGAILYFGLRWSRTDQVSQRLQDFVSDPSEAPQEVTPAMAVRRLEIAGTFADRVLVPLVKKIAGFLGRITPASRMETLRNQLVTAGNPLNLGAREFYGIRVLFMIVAAGAAFLVLRQGLDRNNLLIAGAVVLVCFLFPIYWLRRMMRTRQDKISKEFPDALDMLSVCASAGLGFDQSLQRVGEQWDTNLADELDRVVSEMEMGLSRERAMRNLSDRLGVREISTFVTIILQSEKLGMSIADTLRAQAAQMREERRFNAQEQARKIPNKMLFPLVFLIFPAMFAVILGPAVPELLSLFENF